MRFLRTGLCLKLKICCCHSFDRGQSVLGNLWSLPGAGELWEHVFFTGGPWMAPRSQVRPRPAVCCTVQQKTQFFKLIYQLGSYFCVVFTGNERCTGEDVLSRDARAERSLLCVTEQPWVHGEVCESDTVSKAPAWEKRRQWELSVEV